MALFFFKIVNVNKWKDKFILFWFVVDLLKIVSNPTEMMYSLTSPVQSSIMAPIPPPPPPPSNLTTFTSTNSNSKPPGLPKTSALLKSIEKGKTLKKTVTNDRSAPLLSTQPNSTAQINTAQSSSASSSGNQCGSSAGLGGLFANGFPSLRSTKNTNNNDSKIKTVNSTPALLKIPVSKTIEKVSDSISRNPEKTGNIANKGLKLVSPMLSSQVKNQGEKLGIAVKSSTNNCHKSNKWSFPVLDDKDLPSPRKFSGHKKILFSENTESKIESYSSVSEDDIEIFIKTMKSKLKKSADEENFEECLRLKTKLKSLGI